MDGYDSLLFLGGIASGIVVGAIARQGWGQAQSLTSGTWAVGPSSAGEGTEASGEIPAQALSLPNQNWPLLYAQALELAQFKAGFLGRSAHELRSPLNGIIGLHQLILNDLCDSPAEEREFVAQAHQGILKTLHLMDELIVISKLESLAPQTTFQPQPVALLEILAEVQMLVYMLAANRNLRLDIHLPEPTLQVWAETNTLRQLILNLVDQAIRSMDEGWIHVFVDGPEAAAPTWVNLYIKDGRSPQGWQEPLDWLQRLEQTTTDPLALAADEVALKPSIGLTWLLNYSLVQALGGQLDLVAAADCPRSPSGQDTAAVEPHAVHIRCRLPLVTS